MAISPQISTVNAWAARISLNLPPHTLGKKIILSAHGNMNPHGDLFSVGLCQDMQFTLFNACFLQNIQIFYTIF